MPALPAPEPAFRDPVRQSQTVFRLVMEAMASPGRNQQVIPSFQFSGSGFALEQKASGSREHQHPLGPLLVVPEPGRTCLPCRDNALDPDTFRGNKLREFLVYRIAKDVFEDVSGSSQHCR